MRLPPLIINYTLGNDDVIVAYANKYKVVRGGKILATDDLPKAVANGMVVTTIGGILATNRNIASCTSLRGLHIVYENDDITTLKPFAENLKKLRIQYYDRDHIDFTDKHVSMCTSLEELCIDNHVNFYLYNYDGRVRALLTTCAPFAKTLRKLSIAKYETIGDLGLQMC